MKNTLIITNLICIGIIIFLVKCGDKEAKSFPIQISFTTPEIKGSSDTIYEDSLIYISKTIPDTSNKYLLAYLADSINRLNLFIEAITERVYTESYKDTNQEVIVYSKTRGSLIEQSISYTMFPKTYTIDTIIEVSCPKKNMVFLSGGIGYDIVLNSPSFQSQLSLINKKNRMLSAGINTNRQAFLTYGIKF